MTENRSADIARWSKMTDQERAIEVRRLTDAPPVSLSRDARPLPSVSIIVTARNYARFLKDCLSSCLHQTVNPLEVIYSDDASTDDSVEIARCLSGVRVIACPRHSGAPEARNRGARLARGEVLLFIDGDDQLPTNFVATKLAALTPRHSFAYGDVQEFGAGTTFYKTPTWTERRALWDKNICDTSSAIWAKLFWEVGGWRESPGNCWDWDLWLRLSQVADPVHSGSVLLYRVHDKNDSRTLGFAAPGKKIEDVRDEIHRQAIHGCTFRKRPLRVGFVFPTLALGGADQWLLDLLKHGRMEWSGVALTGATVEGERAKQASEYAMILADARCKSSDVTRVESVKAAVQLVAAESDIMVCWCQEPIAELLGDFSGPVVLPAHGCMSWDAQLVAKQQSRATHFVAVSEAAAVSFKGVKPTIIRNGIDLERCKTTRARASVRKSWGLSDKNIAIGHVGRLAWDKNPLSVSYAVAELGGCYRAVYVGDGWKADDVKQAVRHVSHAVFSGPMDPIGNALRALDCLVLTSPSEGMSLALLEAWAIGLPTVVTPVGAIPELERDHGALTVKVPVNPTPAQVGAGIKQALSARNRKTVERAKSVTREHYSAEAMGRRWKEYLTGISRD